MPRFIFASTATVYGLKGIKAISEDVRPEPTSIYDLHKYYCEEYLRYASKNIGFESISLRLSNVYGPSQMKAKSSDRGILNKVIKNLLEGKDISIYGDGNFLRDYIYIKDVVNALLLAGAAKVKPDYGVYNICYGQSITIRDAFEKTLALIEDNSISKIKDFAMLTPLTEEDFKSHNLLLRQGIQFHWKNNNLPSIKQD